MPSNRFNAHTDYGIGIGLRTPHYRHIFNKKPVVDWFEIISENFMVGGWRALANLDQILERYRVVQHGVSMYLGSAEPLNRDHLRRLKALVKRTRTPWLSDHLCWGSVDGTYSHDLLPMPYTFEAAEVTARKVREARDFLEVPIAVENVSSYAEFHMSEMTEWEFLNEVVERADCGILLDVNNIYVSSRNHDFDPYKYLNSIPADRVAQIHIAGHSKFRKYTLDTHGSSRHRPGLEDVRTRHTPRRSDGDSAGMGRSDSIIRRSPCGSAQGREVPARAGSGDVMTLLEVQRRMANAIFQPLTGSDRMAGAADAEFIKPNNRLTSLERLEIYSRSYWFRILDSLYDDFPGLRAVLGERAFRRLSRAYLTDCPSRSFTLRDLGSRLEDWLRRNPQCAGNRQALALDMVRLEWADIEAFDSAAEKVLGPEDLLELDADFRVRLQPYVRILALQYPVDDLRIQVNRASEDRGAASNTALKQKHRMIRRRVARSNPEPIFLAVHRMDHIVYYRRLAAEEYLTLFALQGGLCIGEAVDLAFKNSSAPMEEQQSMLTTWFAAWAQLGWLCPSQSTKERMMQ
jgi:uncharacterized protein